MMTSHMWMSDVTVFWWMTVKRHSHFLRPGVNHRTPAGSTLKGGGGSEQHILFQHANMDMTWLSYTETQSVHQAASPCSPWTSSPLPLSSHTENQKTLDVGSRPLTQNQVTETPRLFPSRTSQVSLKLFVTETVSWFHVLTCSCYYSLVLDWYLMYITAVIVTVRRTSCHVWCH